MAGLVFFDDQVCGRSENEGGVLVRKDLVQRADEEPSEHIGCSRNRLQDAGQEEVAKGPEHLEQSDHRPIADSAFHHLKTRVLKQLAVSHESEVLIMAREPVEWLEEWGADEGLAAAFEARFISPAATAESQGEWSAADGQEPGGTSKTRGRA